MSGMNRPPSNWWEFISLLVGERQFPQDKCAKCDIDFDTDYHRAGAPHGINLPYGTMTSIGYPTLCERCYGRFLILVAEWFDGSTR